jgi:cytochrome c-type biogenesis protein CcmH/NrfG
MDAATSPFEPTNNRTRCLVSRWPLMVLSALVFTLQLSNTVAADERSDESGAVKQYTQFLKILLRNPRFGTAYDRVYEFHANRGNIQAFRDALAKSSGLRTPPDFDPLEAEQILSVFITPPDPGATALLVGMLDLQHVDGDTAVAALEQAARQRPEDAIAHWYLGKARAMNRQMDLAAESFEHAITCRPAKTDLLEIYKELARTLQRSQQDARALDAWQRLENLFPGDLRVKEQIAVALAQDGRWQDALTRYQAMAEESKNADQRVQANLSAADLMIQLARPQDALELLESQLETLDSDSWLFKEVRRRIEATFRGRNEIPELVAYYEAWVAAHPEDIDAMARLGRTLSLQNRTTEAAAWYRKAIDRAPSNIALRESLIEQLVRDGQLNEAITQYEQMVSFDAGNRDHIEHWGQLYLSRKDLPLSERRAKAAAVWEQILVDRKNDPVTLGRLAELLRRAELTDRAIVLYREAIDLAPDEPQYREYLGEYLHQLQRTDSALAVWKEIAAGDRRTTANLLRVGEILQRFEYFELALEFMREACKLKPDPGERLKFADLLRSAAEGAGKILPAEANGKTHIGHSGEHSRPADINQPLISEALQQLELAEQSAETADEREQILRERIKTFVIAGQLEDQTNRLKAELNLGHGITPERWRTLALYQQAGDRLNEATDAATRVVELEPQSIPGWQILADLHERTGRLGDAVTAMRKLAALDRRGVSDYLRKIARFEIRLGQFDAALQTGRDVVKATPGNPEAYQFFADLAFEIGQPKAAVEALRQAVRVNPGDESSLRALAKTLAEEFQTPEAIELYWRAFEKAADLEGQTNIVVAMSNLYLRSNQFEELIARLELRSRELNLPTEMTRCIATAWREAGDFRKSRETLEGLMIDGSQNVSLLRELRLLAEQEHNLSQMEQYQRQIAELTESAEERRRLIDILGQEHLYEEAAKERLRLAESRTERRDILNEIEILVSGGYDDVAEMLCKRMLESSHDDWEALNAYRRIFHRRHQLIESREMSRRIIQVKIDFDQPATVSGVRQEPATQGSTAMDTAESFSDWLTQTTDDPDMTFGAVYCDCAKSLIFRLGASTPQSDIDMVFASHLSERDQLRLAASLLRTVSVRTPAIQQVWTALATFLEGPPGSARTAIQLLAASQRFSADDLPANAQQELKLRSQSLQKQLIAEAPEWLIQSGILDFKAISSASDNEELAAIVEQQLSNVNKVSELKALWSIAAGIEHAESMKRILETVQKRVLESAAFAADLHMAISDNAAESAETTSIGLRLSNDPDGLLSLLKLLQSLSASTESSIQKAPANGFLTLTEILADHFGVAIGESLSAHLQFLAALHAEHRVEQWLREKLATGPASSERVGLYLLRAELARMLGDKSAEVSSLIDAAEGAPKNDDLRFLIADSAAQQGLIDEAILLLDSLNLTDVSRQIARETFVVQYLLPQGSSERCVLAADRLFGLPLNLDQQRELILILEKLGMSQKVAAVQARLGRGTEDRQSFLGRQLNAYVAQGNDALAGEVAWELLKLASGGSLFSGQRPGDDRDDGGERLQAIKALGRLNRLQPLIDRYEAMLAAAPESLELLEILAEFHESAEQWDLLAAKRDRIALLSKKAPPSLRARATELERDGDVSGACDIYLKILKESPQAFSDEMETYVQAFERARRHADFLTAVLASDRKYWTSHAGLLINVVSGLKDAKTHDDVVQSSIQILLDSEKTRRLALGGFLVRQFSEEQFVPALQTELASQNALVDASRCSEMFQILHSIQLEATLQAIHTFLIPRAEGHQSSGTNSASELPQTAIAGADILLVYLEARLDRHKNVVIRIERLLNQKPNSPESSDASRPKDFQLMVLNTRLKELGPEWNEARLKLLQYLAASNAGGQELTDTVLEDLGDVYNSLGRPKDAAHVLNQRIRRLMTATESSSNSIRQLLQAGESIQHSGFPIEGARLLLNVTEHDIDEFTSDMDDDKAVAFKSRFNASQRWARQQIAADKLTLWFNLAVEALADPGSESEPDLLLELIGTTDPRTQNPAVLQTARISSVILVAIEKQTFDEEKLQTSLKAGISKLLRQEKPHASLLTAALVLSVRMNDSELESGVVEALKSCQGSNTPVESSADETPPGIPQTLRSAADVPLIFAAKILPSLNEPAETIQRLITISATQSRNIENRLVRIALLNDCIAAATLAKLDDLSTALAAERDANIADQIAAVSIGTPASVDLRREIRQRLLGLD